MISSPKFHRAKPIKHSEFYSEVDIIIPFHGQYQKVTRLLESIMRTTRTTRYNITLVDDCSPNVHYTSEWLAKVRGLNLIRTPERMGFAGAAFHGFKNTKAPWCIFINSDCVIEDMSWLNNLGSTLLNMKDQGVRMVSPLTNNAVNGSSAQQLTKEDFMRLGEDEKDNLILDVKYRNEQGEADPQYLSMYCFMCHRDLFKKVGGFIKEYPYGWYEDMEFAYRMNKFGYKQAVCRSTWVYHEGECTIKELWRKQPESRKIMEEDNFLRCSADLKKLNS